MTFTHLSDRAASEIRTLRQILRAHDELRAALFPTRVSHDEEPALVLQLRAVAPGKADWVLHDHCSAVMRMYAIFEQCVDDLVREYLAALPGLYEAYAELPAETLTQHRIGVAHILQRLGKEGLYANFSEASVISGISAGNLQRPYTLFPEAFLTDSNNYRADLVNKVFETLGFDNIWRGAERLVEIQAFMQTRDPNENAAGLLKKLVDERNVASHSRLTSIWGTPEMMAIADFVELLTTGLCAIVERKTLLRRKEVGSLTEVARVIHKYRENVRGLSVSETVLAVGDELIAIDSQTSRVAEVMSLRRGPESVTSFAAAHGDQLGACFNCDLPLGTILLREVAGTQLEFQRTVVDMASGAQNEADRSSSNSSESNYGDDDLQLES